MTRWERLGLGVVFAILAFFAGMLVAVYLIVSSSSTIIAEWTQPDTVDYRSFDPYTLYVVETGAARGPLGRRTTHSVHIVREKNPDSYGHYVDISFDMADDEAAFIRKASVSWTQDGVELTVPSGHRLFVPRDAFVGGR